MDTTLRTDITVKDVCDGFIYNELEGKGLFGLSGTLTIQPEYQRNYIYADGKRYVAVINSLYTIFKAFYLFLCKIVHINSMCIFTILVALNFPTLLFFVIYPFLCVICNKKTAYNKV